MHGSLAGLVSVTASCNAITPGISVIIGGIGRVVMLATATLLEKCHIDDAVGAVPVHLGGRTFW